jgi:hypothetical protein
MEAQGETKSLATINRIYQYHLGIALVRAFSLATGPIGGGLELRTARLRGAEITLASSS